MEGGRNAERLILVCGATGQQGGAVARSLLERGFQVQVGGREASERDRVSVHDPASVFFMQNWEMMREQILDGTLA